jgi:hypothetical protein
MDIVIDILIGLSLVAVVGSFFLGMVAFSHGGAKAAEQSSGWMAWRVRTQAISIAVLLFAAWWKASHG